MKQPTKAELRDRVNELVTELSIARANEMQTKERLASVSEELVQAHKDIQLLNNLLAVIDGEPGGYELVR